MDWKTLILELQQAGLSQAEIGGRMDKSQAWVSSAACGKYADLKWRDGQTLIKLHQSIVDQEKQESACEVPSRIASAVG